MPSGGRIGLHTARAARPAHCRARLGLASWLALSACAGCLEPTGNGSHSGGRTGGQSATPVSSNHPSTPEQPGASVFDRPLRQIRVEFGVMRVTAPQGAFTDDATLWSLVRGALPDAPTAMRLQDNGFRVAIGRDSDRAAIKERLEKLTDPRSALDRAIPNESRLVDLDLGACTPQSSVFYFDGGGQMHGCHYEDARARFRLAYEIRSTNLREVWIQLVPEVEEPPGPPRWVIRPEGARLEPEERRRMFRDLAFSASIPEGGFLMLGPTQDMARQPLLARLFLQQREAGEDGERIRESLYLISPILRTGETEQTERGG